MQDSNQHKVLSKEGCLVVVSEDKQQFVNHVSVGESGLNTRGVIRHTSDCENMVFANESKFEICTSNIRVCIGR